VPTVPQLPGLSSEAHSGHLADDAEEQLAKAAEMLNNAKRPLIFAGQGVQQGHATAQLMELAERANIPVTTSLQGLGVFREDHDLSLQMLGMHGSAVANYAMQSVRR
jgi:acetolactate synthase-1/2/3 large subunit